MTFRSITCAPLRFWPGTSSAKDCSDLVVVSPDAGGVARAEELRGRTGGSLAIISKRHPGPDVSEALEMVGDVAASRRSSSTT